MAGNTRLTKYDLALQLHQHGGFDHPDPSIYTVLTSAANVVRDLPPRWLVAEHLSSAVVPPNLMNEFMGLILGQYDAKAEGFAERREAYNCMSGHGPVPKHQRQHRGTQNGLSGRYLAFMFKPSWCCPRFARRANSQHEYYECWRGWQFKVMSKPCALIEGLIGAPGCSAGVAGWRGRRHYECYLD